MFHKLYHYEFGAHMGPCNYSNSDFKLHKKHKITTIAKLVIEAKQRLKMELEIFPSFWTLPMISTHDLTSIFLMKNAHCNVLVCTSNNPNFEVVSLDGAHPAWFCKNAHYYFGQMLKSFAKISVDLWKCQDNFSYILT